MKGLPANQRLKDWPDQALTDEALLTVGVSDRGVGVMAMVMNVTHEQALAAEASAYMRRLHAAIREVRDAQLEGPSVKRMTVTEFRRLGLLQEINRRFLHPMGLALEVETDDTGEVVGFGEVWDYREDPEGMLFHQSVVLRPEAAVFVDELIEAHLPERKKLFGGATIQPIKEGGS